MKMNDKVLKSMYCVEKEDFKPSPEFDKLAIDAMKETWDYIACDCFEAFDCSTLKRSAVLEMVLDADRMRYGDHTLDVCAYTICIKNHYPTHWKKVLLPGAFPYKTYCY
jgi:hypothetical protein